MKKNGVKKCSLCVCLQYKWMHVYNNGSILLLLTTIHNRLIVSNISTIFNCHNNRNISNNKCQNYTEKLLFNG